MSREVKRGKTFVTVFNAIYAVIALIMLGFGIYFERKHSHLINRIHRDYFSADSNIISLDYVLEMDEKLYIGLLAVSSIAILLVLLNFGHLHRENDEQLRNLGIILATLCVIKICLGCAGIVSVRYPTEKELKLRQNFDYYLDCESCRVTQQFFEEEYDCCGITNHIDYHKLDVTNYPDSCYQHFPDVPIKLNQDGCETKVKAHYAARVTEVALVFLSVGLFEVFGIVSLFYLANALRRSRNAAI